MKIKVKSLNNLLKIKQILPYLIGYFFIKGIKSHDQTALVCCAFVKLYEAGVRGVALIMDCHSTNQAMVSDLEGSLKIDELETKLYHPSNPNVYIYLYFDNCHLIKLMRNTLFHLINLQESEGLNLANKLTNFKSPDFPLHLLCTYFSHKTHKIEFTPTPFLRTTP